MNEKLQDIKNQIWAEGYWSNPTTDKLLPLQLQKFANLIIQECYQVCKDNAMPVEDQQDLSYNDGVFDCALMIKDHFGLLKNEN